MLPTQTRLQRMVLLSALTAVVTMALKFWAWALTDSVGLLSDALESLINLAAAALAWFMITLADQPADDEYPFGHGKAEYFAAAAEGLLILFAAASIAIAAWHRLANPVALEALSIGLVIALVASLCNCLMAIKLLRVAREEDSLVLRADGEHLMSDVWTSVAVVAGLLVIWFWPAQSWLDPVIAMAVAAHLCLTGLRLLTPSLSGLMDEALPHAELQALREAVAGVLPDGSELAGVRTRKAGRRRFVDGNLLVPGTLSVAEAHSLCDRLEDAIRGTLPACDITLHLAPLDDRDRHA